MAGTATFCPGGTYSAHGKLGMFMPPNYPGPAPRGRVTRCYDSLRAAMRAGLRQVPLPAADAIVDGIYLVPTTPALGAGCDRAAHVLGFAVPCPTLLPNPPFGEPPPNCGTGNDFSEQFGLNGDLSCAIGVGPWYQKPFEPIGHLRAFLFQEAAIAAPPEQNFTVTGIPSASITIVATRTHIWDQVANATIGCAGRQPLRTISLGATRAWIRTCGSALAGTTETLLRWDHDGVVYAVAGVGAPAANESLVEAIAEHLAYVEPS